MNGSGRDSYIGCDQGGFESNYTLANDRDAYVNSLRSYPTGARAEQRMLHANARRGVSPKRDHFVEGQMSVRCEKDRKSLNMLKTYQKM